MSSVCALLDQQSKQTRLPLVSVLFVYYKRRETMPESIESALRQDYARREIIIVDNHSQDGFADWIHQRGYPVKVIELPENRGACAGRNAGIRAATGEILVFLDDDMSFMSSSELTSIVETFQKQPNTHTLAFRICEPDTGKLRLREWCHPRYWKDFADTEFETHWFCEGASAFRREVFEVSGGYYEPLFYGAEGHDLSVRMVDHGFRIIYTPRIRVAHRAAAEGRTSHRQYYYFTRNYIWMALKDYNAAQGLAFLFRNLLMMAYFTVRANTYGSFFQGLWDGIRGLRQVWHDRTPIRKSTVKYLADLDKTRPGMLVRLARHKTAPQM